MGKDLATKDIERMDELNDFLSTADYVSVIKGMRGDDMISARYAENVQEAKSELHEIFRKTKNHARVGDGTSTHKNWVSCSDD